MPHSWLEHSRSLLTGTFDIILAQIHGIVLLSWEGLKRTRSLVSVLSSFPLASIRKRTQHTCDLLSGDARVRTTQKRTVLDQRVPGIKGFANGIASI
jgi:hypothetical protein